MLMALSRTSFLFFAGHSDTHRPQPVQSSGAIWIVNFMPLMSRSLKSTDLKVSGAFSSNPGS